LSRRVIGIFGAATAPFERARRIRWTDLAILAAVGGAIFGLVRLAQEWTGTLRPTVVIDLSIRALPGYTLLSLWRGLAAYVLSLGFTLCYGYWAAKDRAAERVLVPALDILQSIPVLGFMPGLVLGLVSLFPHSNVGLELASIVMIFTGAIAPARPGGGGHAEPVRVVAALPLGGAALQRDRARLEQHDEHGGRLVLPDGERGLRPGRQGLPAAGARVLHERRRGAG
jgi:hypothetical protein